MFNQFHSPFFNWSVFVFVFELKVLSTIVSTHRKAIARKNRIFIINSTSQTDWRSVQYSALSPDSEGGRSPEKGESYVIGVIRENFPEEEKLGQELEVCGGWEGHSGQAPEEQRKPY